jgi:hypothetical protein
MPIIAKAGGNFVPAPAGTHCATCVDVVDHGIIEVTYQGRTQRKHKISLVWQIDEDLPDGRPYLVKRRYTCSLHEKSALRRDLESWRGRAFTDEELQAFDLETLLSAPCLLSLIHEQRNGSIYCNVNTIMRMRKGMTAPTPRDYIRVCDRPPAQTDGTEDGLAITDDDVPF